MKYVIIGAGIAGITAAQTLREQASDAKITVLTNEVHPVGLYDRKALARRFAQGSYQDREVILTSEAELRAQGIDILYDPAERVFAARHEVLISHAVRLPYDALLLATGATPMIVNAPGAQYVGVHQLRNYEDVSLMEAWMGELREQGAVVIGGGLLGLEAAWALRQRGIPTTLIVREAHVGAPLLSEAAASFIEAHLQSDGVRVMLNETVAEYQSVDNFMLSAVRLSSGAVLPTRMALCTIGVRANAELAEEAGAAISDTQNGILVNPCLQTSLKDVFAAGNCAQLEDGTTSRHWHEAAEQGRIAALNMLGQQTRYEPAYRGSLTTTLYDLPFAYFGSQVGDPWARQTEQQFVQVWLAQERIISAVLIGEAAKSAESLLELWRNGTSTSADDLSNLIQQPALI